MLETLYLKTIEKKDEINEFFDSVADNIDIEKVKEIYENEKFTKEKQEKKFAAIDGSFNKSKYMAGYVFAITSQTIISKRPNEIIKDSAISDVQAISLIHNRKIDKILSARMNILELKSSIDTLKKHQDLDYLLMDGSIRGTLLNFQTGYNIPREIMNYLVIRSSIFDDELKKDEISLESTTQKNQNEILIEIEEKMNKEEFNADFEEIKEDVLFYLESLEQLSCINYLLNNYKNKIICVSKTSSTKSVFNEIIPDSAVIEYVCPKSGLTKPNYLDANKLVRYQEERKIIVDYPIHGHSLSNNIYTTFFAKLEDRSNVLKLEIPYKIDDKEEIKSILNDLHSISIEGYPHILKKAHDEVKITSKYMKRLERYLGMNMHKTGRDML